MPFLLLLLQTDEDVSVPFGTFMEAVPHWVFVIIHSTLMILGVALSRRARAAGYATAATGFLLFCLAELSYVTYHLHLTHFLFAHPVAEVFDAMALVTIAIGISSGKRM